MHRCPGEIDVVTALVLASTLFLAACAPSPRPGDAAPGDALADVATSIAIDVPDTTVTARVAERLDAAVEGAGGVEGASVLVVSAPISAWQRRPALPPGLAGSLPDDTAVFVAHVDVPPGVSPTVLVSGERQPRRHAGAPLPSPFVFWDAETARLYALATRPPRRVRIAFEQPVAEEFAVWDARRLVLGDAPTLDELTRRAELGPRSHPVVVTPGPSRIAFELPPLGADELVFAVGVLDRGWRVARFGDVSGVSRSPARPCPGASFAVDVTDGDDTTRVWTAEVTGDNVGARFVDQVVDLSPWRGRAVTLTLVAEPLPGEPAEHVYAAWTPPRLRSDDAPPPRRPHVVLIDIDTLRADRLGCYGSPRPTSPRIDAWAAEHGVVFENARSTGPYTLPATASMLTGLDVHQHGVDVTGEALSVGAGSIAQVLAAHGYDTHAVVEGGYVSTSFGFDHGFESFVTRPAQQPAWDAALDDVARRGSARPLFLFLHTFVVHHPLEHDPRFVDPGYRGDLAGRGLSVEFVEEFRAGRRELDAADRRYVADLYDAAVRRMDDLVGDTLARLPDVLDGELLVIVTSDHGEELFERDDFGHGRSLYGEVLDVPLIVSVPGGRVGRDGRPASLVDLVPTILDVAGLRAPPHLPGHSLAAPPRAGRALVGRHGGEHYAVEVDGWKLIDGEISTPRRDDPPRLLFDLAADADESVNLVDERAERASALDERLEEYLRRWTAPTGAAAGSVSSSTLEALEALGYTDGGH